MWVFQASVCLQCSLQWCSGWPALQVLCLPPRLLCTALLGGGIVPGLEGCAHVHSIWSLAFSRPATFSWCLCTGHAPFKVQHRHGGGRVWSHCLLCCACQVMLHRHGGPGWYTWRHECCCGLTLFLRPSSITSWQDRIFKWLHSVVTAFRRVSWRFVLACGRLSGLCASDWGA